MKLALFGYGGHAREVAAQMNEEITFFVDEDESRIGKEHLGLPIVHPNNVPAGAFSSTELFDKDTSAGASFASLTEIAKNCSLNSPPASVDRIRTE